MGELVARFNQFHKTKAGYAILGVIELALLYYFAIIAIDTASMWIYLIAIILLVSALYNLFMLARKALITRE